jgi:plasmid stabilization system protein ParE
MARKIRWSSNALADLEAIAEYIAQDSPTNAAKVVQKIVSTAKGLNRFPHLGLAVPEVHNPEIRQRLIFHYRLIYRLTSGEIEILSVIHSRRQLGPKV